jgi:hypothetical protein
MDLEHKMEFRTKVKDMTVFIIMAAGLLTTIEIFTEPSVFADKCNKNGDNNCNDTDIDQKIGTGNKCKIDNLSKDHSNENLDDNLLGCINTAQNVKNLATIPDQFAATN